MLRTKDGNGIIIGYGSNPQERQKKEIEIKDGVITTNFCSWNRLKEYLQHAAGGKDIDGLIADEQGIVIVLKD